MQKYTKTQFLFVRILKKNTNFFYEFTLLCSTVLVCFKLIKKIFFFNLDDFADLEEFFLLRVRFK